MQRLFGRNICKKIIRGSNFRFLSSWNKPVKGDALERPIEFFDASAPDSILLNIKSALEVHPSTSVFDVPEGGYLTLNERECEKYFPEGFAGECNHEFFMLVDDKEAIPVDNRQKRSWMIRNPTKMLCRLIEEFEARKYSTPRSVPRALHIPIDIPNFTDRPEWPQSTMQVHYRGQLLSPKPAKFGKARKLRNAEPQIGSDYDSSMAALTKLLLDEKSNPLPTKVLLTGDRGVGKSMALCQAVMFARQRGWLCLYIPKGWDQVQSGDFITPLTGPQYEPPNRVYDNNMMSAELLRGFWRAHADKLREIPVTDPAMIDKYVPVMEKFHTEWKRALTVPGRTKLTFMEMRAIIEADEWAGAPEAVAQFDALDSDVLKGFSFLDFKLKTLEDLVRLGVALRDVSGLAVLDLVAELRQLESVPVLIAVDQYNTWFTNSAFSYEEVPVKGTQLCVPHALSFIPETKEDDEGTWSLKNGLCIAATSLKHTEGKKVAFNRLGSIPLHIKVPAYSQVEFLSACLRYASEEYLNMDASLSNLLAFRMNTGSTPRLVRKEVNGFFLPIALKELVPDNDYMALEENKEFMDTVARIAQGGGGRGAGITGQRGVGDRERGDGEEGDTGGAY